MTLVEGSSEDVWGKSILGRVRARGRRPEDTVFEEQPGGQRGWSVVRGEHWRQGGAGDRSWVGGIL